MSLDRVLMVVAAAALTSGCHLFGKLTPDCHTRQEYQRAAQVPPLKVPPGLDSPNTQGALVIPTVELAPPPPGAQGQLSRRSAALQAGTAQQGGQQQLGAGAGVPSWAPTPGTPGLGSRAVYAVDLIAWVASGTLAAAWRGGRAVEGARLESV